MTTILVKLLNINEKCQFLFKLKINAKKCRIKFKRAKKNLRHLKHHNKMTLKISAID